MGVKAETSFQQRLQVMIKRRGGYVKKNHGNMITERGRSDLSFTYRGLSLYWEVKTPEDPTDVSEQQGIHCRLAKKAGGITAVISDMMQAETILDHIDYCLAQEYPIPTILDEMNAFYAKLGFDDGAKY